MKLNNRIVDCLLLMVLLSNIFLSISEIQIKEDIKSQSPANNSQLLSISPDSTIEKLLTINPSTNWTFLFYIDSDVDLEEYGLRTFLELTRYEIPDHINILVQMDRHNDRSSLYGNWTGALRFKLSKGMEPLMSEAIVDLGEVNMGSANVLSDFLQWGVESHPANHYVFIPWNHGGGVDGICYDETNMDHLSLPELSSAMAAPGIIFDLTVLMGCNMGTIEVFSQLQNVTRKCIASEDVIYGHEFPWDTIFNEIYSIADIKSDIVAQIIVNEFIKRPMESSTIAIVNLTTLPRIEAYLKQLANLIYHNVNNDFEGISYIRLKSQTTTFDINHIDIVDFCEHLGDYYSSNLSIIDISNKIKNWVKENTHFRLSGRYSDNSASFPNFHGISIYFPLNPKNIHKYNDIHLYLKTNWNNAIKKFARQFLAEFDDPFEYNSDISTYSGQWLSEINKTAILNEKDEYYLKIRNEKTLLNLDFHVSALNSFHLLISIYDLQKNELILSDIVYRSHQTVIFSLPKAGNYIILIEQIIYQNISFGLIYDFKWFCSPFSPQDDYFDCLTTSSAYDLSLYGDNKWLSNISGPAILHNSNDHRIFKLNIPHNKRLISVEFKGNDTYKGVLYDENYFVENKFYFRKDMKEEWNTIVLKGGVYYLYIEPHKINDNWTNIEINFRWRCYSITDDPYEPNNSFGEALDILGEIETNIQHNEDWFYISPSKFNENFIREIEVEVFVDSYAKDLSLSIYDFNYELIYDCSIPYWDFTYRFNTSAQDRTYFCIKGNNNSSVYQISAFYQIIESNGKPGNISPSSSEVGQRTISGYYTETLFIIIFILGISIVNKNRLSH